MHGFPAITMVFDTLNIAGLPVYWQEDRSSFVRDFVVSEKSEPVIRVNFSDNLLSSHSVQYTDKPVSHFLRTASGDILVSDEHWSEVTSYCLPKDNKDYALPLAAICSRFSDFGVLLAHAALVEFNGEGIMFAGPSGIGKTTQAQLWEKFKCAEIINGDKAFIRNVDGAFYAYGLPWKGSSEYCLNKSVPLKAIVVLKQSAENSINKLQSDLIELFMPHIFFPHWDKDCLINALDTFDILINNVPVYLLECRPDNDAVQLTYNTIFG